MWFQPYELWTCLSSSSDMKSSSSKPLTFLCPSPANSRPELPTQEFLQLLQRLNIDKESIVVFCWHVCWVSSCQPSFLLSPPKCSGASCAPQWQKHSNVAYFAEIWALISDFELTFWPQLARESCHMLPVNNDIFFLWNNGKYLKSQVFKCYI